MTCVALTYVRGAAIPLGRKITCTPLVPRVVGTCVQGLGQVVEFSNTGVAGPMGLAALAKIEISSPGDTAPVAKLAPLSTPLITGKGAVTVKDRLTMVVPVAGLVAATVMVPEYGDPAGVSVASTDETTEAVRLSVPALGVVPEVGET